MPATKTSNGHAGSSPALYVACPVCEQSAGDYCMRENGAPQIIAHKQRRELAARIYAAHANDVFRALGAKS